MPEGGVKTHVFRCRVYYEDTDLAGIVYHANYLKFIERARSEWVRTLGIDQRALKAGPGLVFAVRDIAADFLAPARYDDLLDIATVPGDCSGARMVLHQRIVRAQTLLFVARVTLVCLDGRARPVRLPAVLRQLGADHG